MPKPNPTTTVANVKVAHIRPAYDNLREWMADESHVYVGRPGVVFIDRQRFPQGPSKWGNPYQVGKHGTREEVIALYRTYLETSGLIDDVSELRGKVLGCWCHPEACHADVLAELADTLPF